MRLRHQVGHNHLTANIQVTDATVALDDAGEGVPVLLLHGFPATRHLWSRVAPSLIDAGFRVLVPDLVGYGASEAPARVRVDMASQARWKSLLLAGPSCPHPGRRLEAGRGGAHSETGPEPSLPCEADPAGRDHGGPHGLAGGR